MGIVVVLRFIGGILAGITAYQLLQNLAELPARTSMDQWVLYAAVAASFGIGYLLTPYVTTRPFFWVRERIYHATAVDVLAAGVGLVFGLLVGALLAFPLSFLPGYLGSVLPILASVVMAYFGILTLLAHKQGLLTVFGFGGRAVERSAVASSRLLLVDSSAIIDGRLADISRTGFLGGTLVVPRFVLEEIQLIADSADALRRTRGRRGLEVLNRLQKESGCPVEISDVEVDHAVGVDAKLVRLARTWSCPIITNDFNLNHVAQIQGVEVLNVNELAQAVRSAVLQGEEMAVHIVQEGKEAGQGVGFLDDGTMIVVEHGRECLGNTVEVTVTKVLQTAAGRMIFARLRPDANGARS
jgi:uncharacterized protein YacL